MDVTFECFYDVMKQQHARISRKNLPVTLKLENSVTS